MGSIGAPRLRMRYAAVQGDFLVGLPDLRRSALSMTKAGSIVLKLIENTVSTAGQHPSPLLHSSWCFKRVTDRVRQ
jgi:hypothetical protein